jgi:hypothetical protein
MNIDQQKVADWLNKHWDGAKSCPVCRSNNWSIPDMAFELRQFFGGNRVLGGPIIPLVPITCGTCGHVMMFNAILLGVVKAEVEAPEGVASNQ